MRLRIFLVSLFLFAGVNLQAANKKMSAMHHIILIENMVFNPSEIAVKRGDSVTWINKDLVPHTVTAINNKFDSGSIPPNGKWKYRITKQENFEYHCVFHPGMIGKIKP